MKLEIYVQYSWFKKAIMKIKVTDNFIKNILHF